MPSFPELAISESVAVAAATAATTAATAVTATTELKGPCATAGDEGLFATSRLAGAKDIGR